MNRLRSLVWVQEREKVSRSSSVLCSTFLTLFHAEIDEIDSYMYQTVGHSGLFAIAAALDLPLFTHTISGTPLNLSSEYGSREGSESRNNEEKGKMKGTLGDETEDLYELLLKVKVCPMVFSRLVLAHLLSQTAMPEIEAVSCGAILSNYQRVRVEHV